MAPQVATLYGANSFVLARATAMRTSSTSGALAVLRLDRVDFLLAGAVREGGVDLEAVLGGEGGQDRAVVRPRGRQRDDVERAFLLGRRDQRGHAAACRGGRLWG